MRNVTITVSSSLLDRAREEAGRQCRSLSGQFAWLILENSPGGDGDASHFQDPVPEEKPGPVAPSPEPL